MHAILAYVITYFGQAKNHVGQVKVIWPGKLVLKLMLVPDKAIPNLYCSVVFHSHLGRSGTSYFKIMPQNNDLLI